MKKTIFVLGVVIAASCNRGSYTAEKKDIPPRIVDEIRFLQEKLQTIKGNKAALKRAYVAEQQKKLVELNTNLSQKKTR